MEPLSAPVDTPTTALAAAHAVATIATKNRQQTNLIWERTQAAIAIGTTLAYLVAQIFGRATPAEGLANAFFLVIGFYFGRTNHARPSGTIALRRQDDAS